MWELRQEVTIILKRTFKRWFRQAGSDVSFLMFHSTRHRIALTTVKPLLSSKLWRLSPWHRMPERNRFKLTPKTAPMISIWSIRAPRSHKFSSLMVKMADTSYWSSVLLRIFLTILSSCVTLLEELVPSKRCTAGTSARCMLWQWTGIFRCLILVTCLLWFGLSWFSVVFVMRCCRFFSISCWFRWLPVNAFFTDPRHGRYCGRYVPGA